MDWSAKPLSAAHRPTTPLLRASRTHSSCGRSSISCASLRSAYLFIRSPISRLRWCLENSALCKLKHQSSHLNRQLNSSKTLAFRERGCLFGIRGCKASETETAIPAVSGSEHRKTKIGRSDNFFQRNSSISDPATAIALVENWPSAQNKSSTESTGDKTSG
jgi:hypothetical protein